MREPRRDRFFVSCVSSLFGALGAWLRPIDQGAKTQHESVFFDDGWLTLGGDERARARRRDQGGEARYTVDVPKRLRSLVRASEPTTLAGATDAMRRAFGIEGIAPYCAVRWKRQRFALGELGSLTIDTEVSYFGVSPSGRFVAAGEECHPRVAIHLPERESRALERALRALPKLPHCSKRWMAYFRMRKLVKPPRFNELPGYEYEIKLDASAPGGKRPVIDPACLPFPIHRVYETESTRYYYDGHRIQFRAFRTGRATLVRKGKAEWIDGVPRRAEEKQRGLSPWELTRPRYALQRIKKTYLLLNPATERMYNLCLEVCRTGEGLSAEMTQVEVEYRGRLTPCARPESDAEVERAVLADLRAVEKALIERHGMRPTNATKRAWLKKHARTGV